jgi:clathrin heavy chain
MQCDMSEELIKLLERIILQFSNNKNLQNLWILTAIRASMSKVMEYINRLDNFDGPEIAKITASEANELYEEACMVYVKFAKKSSGEEQTGRQVATVEILVDKICGLDRAKELAEHVNNSAVCQFLIELNKMLVTEAISSYIEAKDATNYIMVINVAESVRYYGDLVSSLKMARKQIKECIIDTQLMYAFARMDKFAELEECIKCCNN